MKGLFKTNQEQAVASWVNYLNQLRIDNLLMSFANQDENLQNAMDSLNQAMRTIDLEIVATNRGGQKGMHGFIAEIAEVGIANARERIAGREDVYRWINDNGPVDMVRSGMNIQQKFSASGGRFSLLAVKEHLEKYPDYIAGGGKYQLPRDHWEMIQKLHSLSPEEAGRTLSRSGDGPSFKDWQRVQDFFKERSVGLDSIEASKLEYHEVQRGAYRSTFGAEKSALKSTNQGLRDKVYQDSLPSLQERARTTAVAAAVEGGAAFILAVAAKRRSGKQLKGFTEEDWSEVLGKSGKGAVTGVVRGLSMYSLSNFTASSAAVANSIVTATLGVAEQAHKFRTGEIGEIEFVENAELLCLQSAVSALSSVIGQAAIPLPVLGAVIGNTVGMVIYQAISSSLSEKETKLIDRYLADQRALDSELTAEFHNHVEILGECMSNYLTVLERAFSPDLGRALLGSVELARELGVPDEEILDTKEKTNSYFLS